LELTSITTTLSTCTLDMMLCCSVDSVQYMRNVTVFDSVTYSKYKNDSVIRYTFKVTYN